MQFDEGSEAYRCCCQCMHVKTGAAVVGIVELGVFAVLLINSLLLIANTNAEYNDLVGLSNVEVFVPFGLAMLGVAAGLLCVLLMFAAIVNKAPAWVVPHLVLQIVAVLLLAATVMMGALALATDRTIFYRVLNAVDFRPPPDSNTVALSTRERVHVAAVVGLYAVFGVLEVWFLWVVWRCYVYLREKRDYMKYCQAYCTPMKNVQVRSHHHDSNYSPRNR